MFARMQRLLGGITLAMVAIERTAVPVSAATNSKFGAWAGYSWIDTSIPLQFGSMVYDVRQERQYAGACNRAYAPEDPVESHQNCRMNAISLAVAFATTHKGHLYILGDEADREAGVTPLDYAYWYRQFTINVLAADPTARFSPAGFTENLPGDDPSRAHFTAFAQMFIDQWHIYYPGDPPVDEWRFNVGSASDWLAQMDAAATWANLRGKKVTFSFLPQNVLAVQQAIDHVKNDPRVAHLVYWHFNDAGPGGIPLQSGGTLTSVGVTFRNAAIGQPSLARDSMSAIGDYDGDGYADFADHYLPDGHFWVHRNLQDGSFSSANWAEGFTSAGVDWDWLVGRFTGGDLRADYADVHLPSKQVWLHHNSGNGTFESLSSGYADVSLQGVSDVGVPDVEILSGDFDGDGKTDLAKRELASGLLWIYLNNGDGTFTWQNQAIARTKTGPDWRTVIADFTGDGKADYADHYKPTGVMTVHRNNGIPNFGDASAPYSMDSVAWGTASPTPGSDWRTFVGDFTGDGWADYADLYLPTGLFWMHQNLQNGTFQQPGFSWGTGNANPGGNWEILGGR